MHEWFARYMQGQLEDYLPDPFEDICKMLSDGVAFSFSRFGDGEFAAIFEVEGKNSDGHRFFPDLGVRLKEIVERKPDYMMGLQTQALLAHGALPIRSLSPDIQWVLADSLHNASMEGTLGNFFDSLADREVHLVGAPHHRQLAEEKSWQFLEVPYGDCWPQYESIRAGLEPRVTPDDLVFLLCASMTANVLIDDMYSLNPSNTYIDAGSVLDPYAGVRSRAYHKELNSNPLMGIDYS